MWVNDKLADLKTAVEQADQEARYARDLYTSCKAIFAAQQGAFMSAKTQRNRSYTDWVKARKRLDKARRKLRSFPSEVRQYGKKHPLKVLE